MSEYIKIHNKEVLLAHGIELSPHTFRKWYNGNKNPELFIKDGKYIKLNLDEWKARLMRIQEERSAEIAKLRKRGVVVL